MNRGSYNPQDVYHNIIMVNSRDISIFQRALNNIYISFVIVVLIFIGKLLYLTLYQIVRYIYSNSFLYST